MTGIVQKVLEAQLGSENSWIRHLQAAAAPGSLAARVASPREHCHGRGKDRAHEQLRGCLACQQLTSQLCRSWEGSTESRIKPLAACAFSRLLWVAGCLAQPRNGLACPKVPSKVHVCAAVHN